MNAEPEFSAQSRKRKRRRSRAAAGGKPQPARRAVYPPRTAVWGDNGELLAVIEGKITEEDLRVARALAAGGMPPAHRAHAEP